MGQYKNEEYLKKQIMEQSRHLFIYGYNDEHRSDFLKSLEYDYPVIADSDKPVALYFDSLGMPKLDVNLKDKDGYLIHVACREYLSFTIATRILERSMEFDKTILDSRLSRLIGLINKIYINKNVRHAKIETTLDLLKEIKISRDFYYESYINYAKGMIERISIDDIAIPFLQSEMFVRLYKESMNINSYFGIIFDKKSPLTISSTKEINDLIGSRINGDISVKVAIEPNDWETYKDTNGQFVEAVHDYGTVELDDSLKEHMKILTKHFWLNTWNTQNCKIKTCGLGKKVLIKLSNKWIVGFLCDINI